MATSLQTEYNPDGTVKLKKGDPGYVDPTVPNQSTTNPSAVVALSDAAKSGAAATDAGNTAVLAKAQQDVLNQPATNALQDATTKASLDWVNKPMGDFDPAKNKQQRMETANADWAKAFEAQRQNYGNVSGSGLLQENMLQNALEHNVDQAALESNIDKENFDKYMAAMGQSIGTGNQTSQQNENIFSQRLQNLGTVRGMAEGERAQETGFKENVALTQLGFNNDVQKMAIENGYDLNKLNVVYGQDMAKMIATQDWTAGQAALDRAQQLAVQANDISAQKDIAKLQQQFATNERIATQSWQTGERVSAQDAAKAAQYFDAQQKLLLQKNDLEGQKVLSTLKNSFDLNMQTNAMNHDEKMAYLDNQYKTAMANGDVARQKDILAFTYNQDIAKMTAEQGFDVAKITLQGNIDKALQAGDFAHAEAMQKALFTQQSAENAKDRTIEQAKVALQAKGVDLAAVEQQYNQLEALVKAGTVDKSVLTDFVAKTMGGVTLKAPDPLEAQKEADKEFKALQVEYARTHPGSLDANDNLTPDALKGFNAFVNKSMYGEATTGTEAASQKAEAAIADPAKYEELLSDPTVKEWKPEMSYDSGGFWGTDSRSFANAPSKGSLFKYNGVVYETLTDPVMETKGQNRQKFTVKDLKTGTVRTISINPSITGQITGYSPEATRAWLTGF
jgi:hypothetical protein